jgi:hypothetical protein
LQMQHQGQPQQQCCELHPSATTLLISATKTCALSARFAE